MFFASFICVIINYVRLFIYLTYICGINRVPTVSSAGIVLVYSSLSLIHDTGTAQAVWLLGNIIATASSSLLSLTSCKH